MDYFDWNFILGFAVVAVVIALGISKKPPNVRWVALSLPILMLQVCAQMVLLVPLSAMHVRAPFRFSSIGRGELLKPAVYVIAEDVIAVDAKQGDVFRAQWKARYESSQPFRNLLTQLDLLWGVSGVLTAGGIIAVIFAVKQTDVGWAVGKSMTNPSENLQLKRCRMGRAMDLDCNYVIDHVQAGRVYMQAGRCIGQRCSLNLEENIAFNERPSEKSGWWGGGRFPKLKACQEGESRAS